jgi:hypothetical protein
VVSAGLADEDPQMMEAFAGVYLLRVDIDEWSDAEMMNAGFDFSVIPIFFRLDAEGRPTGDVIDGGAWGPDTYENIASTMGPWFHQP